MNVDEFTNKHGVISHDEAHQMLDRFIASHFNKPNKEHARASIPADYRRDDDLRLSKYIDQQQLRDEELAGLRAGYDRQAKLISEFRRFFTDFLKLAADVSPDAVRIAISQAEGK